MSWTPKVSFFRNNAISPTFWQISFQTVTAKAIPGKQTSEKQISFYLFSHTQNFCLDLVISSFKASYENLSFPDFGGMGV